MYLLRTQRSLTPSSIRQRKVHRTFHTRLLTASALLILTTTGLRAQKIQIQGETTTLLGVYAETAAGLVTQTKPKGTRFLSSLLMRTTSGATTTEAKGTILANSARFEIGGTASPFGKGLGRSGGYSDPKTRKGAAGMRFTFSSSTPVSGRMLVVMSPKSKFVGWGNLITAQTKVRVGQHTPTSADIFFGLTITREFAVTLTSTGTTVDIDIEAHAIAATTLTYAMEVEVTFVPGHRVTSWGENCSDLHTRFPSSSEIEFHLQGSVSNSPTILIFGDRKTKVSIGFPSCDLLVQPAVILLGPLTNASSRATVRIPHPNKNLKILVQSALYEPMFRIFQLSNGVEIELVKR